MAKFHASATWLVYVRDLFDSDCGPEAHPDCCKHRPDLLTRLPHVIWLMLRLCAAGILALSLHQCRRS